MTLRTEPVEVPLQNGVISALVRRDAAGAWAVTVVISRRPGDPLIGGDEVEAELASAGRQSLPIVARPSGPLVEAGGSLRSSANAVFKFKDVAADPHELTVRWRGEVARFRIVQA